MLNELNIVKDRLADQINWIHFPYKYDLVLVGLLYKYF